MVFISSGKDWNGHDSVKSKNFDEFFLNHYHLDGAKRVRVTWGQKEIKLCIEAWDFDWWSSRINQPILGHELKTRRSVSETTKHLNSNIVLFPLHNQIGCEISLTTEGVGSGTHKKRVWSRSERRLRKRRFPGLRKYPRLWIQTVLWNRFHKNFGSRMSKSDWGVTQSLLAFQTWD